MLYREIIAVCSERRMSVCRECCVLSSRGLCGELITRPEESCRLWCIVVCDLETSRMRRSWPALDRSTTRKKNYRNFSLLNLIRLEIISIITFKNYILICRLHCLMKHEFTSQPTKYIKLQERI